MSHPYFALPRPVVIGHRGCAGEAPENTLLSFARGLADGAAILESDVHVTRDGVPVLSHDPDVARTTNGRGLVADHDFAQLGELDAGYAFESQGSHPFRGREVRIPSLAQVLAEFPDARFNLELKADSPGAVTHTLDAIAAAGAAERSLLTAENDGVMQELHRELDAREMPVARGASAPDVLGFVRAALDGTTPTTRAMALQVPAHFGSGELVTAEFVTHAHAHEIQVHVWTINDEAEMQRLLDLDVDGLVTDFPARMAEVARQRAT